MISHFKNAQNPIARARGSEALVGWFKVRSFKPDLPKDARGNFRGAKTDIIQHEGVFIHAGTAARTVDSDSFVAKVGGLTIEISQSDAGVIVQSSPAVLVIAAAHARLRFQGKSLQGKSQLKAETGYFIGERWRRNNQAALVPDGDGVVLTIEQPAVVRLSY